MQLVHEYLFPVVWWSWVIYWYASSLSASTPKKGKNRVPGCFTVPS